MKNLKWGVIGAGEIAKVFCCGMSFSKTGKIVAVASRSQERAVDLANSFSIPQYYTSYQELLDNDEIDAVYIATIHPKHAEWVLKAAAAKKHILVEKPIGMNATEAAAMIAAARENNVFLMEAFMYRCHPQIAKVAELIKQGKIGDVRLIRASFSYKGHGDLTRRTYANEMGGGGIMDVGCYAISMARLLAGAAAGKAFDEPIEVKGCGEIGSTGVDVYAVASLKFAGGIVAEIACGVECDLPHEAAVYGSTGSILIENPWIPGDPSRMVLEPLPPDTNFSDEKIIVNSYGQGSEEIMVETERHLYAYEADMVAEHIEQGQAPAMNWDDTLGNMALLDRWRQEVGVVYEQEEKFSPGLTLAGSKLQRSDNNNMKYGKIPGLDKQVSRLVHGADHNGAIPYTEIMFDKFFELGGTVFDTSHGYGAACERNLADWARNRGVRDQVVIVEKGGNPPNGTPEGITKELHESLERTSLDFVDVYLMHRDNPDVPVGELVDILNEHQRAGLFTVFGVSNWSLPRLKEAKEYATRTGQNFFSLVSNQFSLARILDVWWNVGGHYQCWASSSDLESRKWFEETQMPLMPWSSQASGFFVEKEKSVDDFALKRCWGSEENLERRRRTLELAKARGVDGTNIALAWVLGQNFPVFPVIGPRNPIETMNCMQALDIKLTKEEMLWLDLDD